MIGIGGSPAPWGPSALIDGDYASPPAGAAKPVTASIATPRHGPPEPPPCVADGPEGPSGPVGTSSRRRPLPPTRPGRPATRAAVPFSPPPSTIPRHAPPPRAAHDVRDDGRGGARGARHQRHGQDLSLDGSEVYRLLRGRPGTLTTIPLRSPRKSTRPTVNERQRGRRRCESAMRGIVICWENTSRPPACPSSPSPPTLPSPRHETSPRAVHGATDDGRGGVLCPDSWLWGEPPEGFHQAGDSL